MSHNLDTNTIYEIFRACRLCGAGGGYKMPIIPSVVGFDCADIELRQKIRECVQIEVNQEDKMPPLICELCVDKVNDFYEFLEMCRDTNTKTRQRLGLPDTYPQSFSEGDNCILGVTEPVYVQDDDDEPLSRRTTRMPVKIKKEEKNNKKEKDRVKTLKKELENLIKQEHTSRESRSSRGEKRLDSSSSSRSSRNKRTPTPPPRETRQSLASDNTSLNRLKEQQKNLKPKSILKKEKEETLSIGSEDEMEDDRPAGSKRTRDRDHKDAPDKKIKLTIKLPRPPTPPKTKHHPGPKSSKRAESPPKTQNPPPPGPKSSKPGPKSSKIPSTTPISKAGPKSSKRTASPPPKTTITPSSTLISKPGPKSSKRTNSPPPKSSKRVHSPIPPSPEHACSICASVLQTVQGYTSHMRTHTVKYTPNVLACNPCGEWFTTTEETTAHHKLHKNRNKPYRCRGCRTDYRLLNEYNQHIAETSCVPWTEVPDVKCAECWKEYPTNNLRKQHRCGGKDARPGGKCSKCNKMYQTIKSLKKHESTCTSKKKSVEPWSGVKISSSVRRRLLHARISLARCDELLRRNKRGRYDVGKLAHDFGVEAGLVYPYRALVRVKREPLAADHMVSIQRDVRDEFYKEEDYVHWDSDAGASSDEDSLCLRAPANRSRVPSLTALALKTLFSRRCLGKVPRKLRKVRTEKFDSFFNPDAEFDNVQSDINNIIDKLGDDDDNDETKFSLKDIKLTDVKSISEAVTDTDSINIDINDINGDANYESDSLIDDKQQSATDEGKVDSDAAKNNENSNIEQIPSNNLVHSIKNLVNIDNGSETDASLDDNKSQKENDEKSTASEISQDLDIGTANNTDNLTNGKSLETEMTVEKSNGATETQSDLINDINELYDTNIMEALDAQIAEKQVNVTDKVEKMLLEDLVPNTKSSVTGLDDISDEEFNFDA